MLVVKRFTFEAAHFLPYYDGACSRVHGHSYKLEVGVTGDIHPKTGMIIDFKRLKQEVENHVISILDHQYLNELPVYWNENNPTAENIVAWIVDQLRPRPILKGLALVRLWETEDSYVEWRKS